MLLLPPFCFPSYREHSSLTLGLCAFGAPYGRTRPFDLSSFESCGVPCRQQDATCTRILLTAVGSCVYRSPLVAGSSRVLWLVTHIPLHCHSQPVSRTMISCVESNTAVAYTRYTNRRLVGIVQHPAPGHNDAAHHTQ